MLHGLTDGCIREAGDKGWWSIERYFQICVFLSFAHAFTQYFLPIIFRLLRDKKSIESFCASSSHQSGFQRNSPIGVRVARWRCKSQIV